MARKKPVSVRCKPRSEICPEFVYSTAIKAIEAVAGMVADLPDDSCMRCPPMDKIVGVADRVNLLLNSIICQVLDLNDPWPGDPPNCCPPVAYRFPGGANG